MWIFTNKGFLPIIQDFRDPDILIVRSRFPDHIQNFFPDAKVTKTTSRDYLYRTLLPRQEVAAHGEDADHFKVFNIQFNPHEIPVVFDKEDFHKARGSNKAVNYLYADGHIKNLLAIEGTK